MSHDTFRKIIGIFQKAECDNCPKTLICLYTSILILMAAINIAKRKGKNVGKYGFLIHRPGHGVWSPVFHQALHFFRDQLLPQANDYASDTGFTECFQNCTQCTTLLSRDPASVKEGVDHSSFSLHHPSSLGNSLSCGKNVYFLIAPLQISG